MQPLLTRAEVGERLGISARGVDRLRVAGAIPFLRIGQLTRYDSRDIEAYIESKKCRSTDQESAASTGSGSSTKASTTANRSGLAKRKSLAIKPPRSIGEFLPASGRATNRRSPN